MRIAAAFKTAVLAVALLSVFYCEMSAETQLPKPRENVLRLNKPTIVYRFYVEITSFGSSTGTDRTTDSG